MGWARTHKSEPAGSRMGPKRTLFWGMTVPLTVPLDTVQFLVAPAREKIYEASRKLRVLLNKNQ